MRYRTAPPILMKAGPVFSHLQRCKVRWLIPHRRDSSISLRCLTLTSFEVAGWRPWWEELNDILASSRSGLRSTTLGSDRRCNNSREFAATEIWMEEQKGVTAQKIEAAGN